MKIKIISTLLILQVLFANDIYTPKCYDDCIKQCEKKVNNKNKCSEICLVCTEKYSANFK